MRKLILLCFALTLFASMDAKTVCIDMSAYGLRPNTKQDGTAALSAALQTIKSQIRPSDKVVLQFAKGRYDFHSEQAKAYTYYISNHDQDQPKRVVFNLDGWKNLTIDGNGSDFIFHGRLIPFVLVNSSNCRLKNFSIDFEQPQIAQMEIKENDEQKGITFEVAPWVTYKQAPDSSFVATGEGWENPLFMGIAFDKKTRHMVFNTSDINVNTKGALEISPRTFWAPKWKNKSLKPGTIVALRSWYRPCPGIFMMENKNTELDNVKIHYAEGMGLIAYRCTNITLDGFGVCLRGADDPRYFTTQADATHFSQCKGKIVSRNGLYENMMDDAINIHGIYLKVNERLDDYTLKVAYGHGQAWGFAWGDKGDKISFIRSLTMEYVGESNELTSIEPYGGNGNLGAKGFVLRFKNPLPLEVSGKGFGVEDLSWCPTVEFSRNTIRNNRARGALFSSPLKTVCEDNVFDHTSGTAVLLCGDCNGWYESGACRKLIIRGNKFINALTNLFQFTNAVISICPEIPNISKQKSLFHGGTKGAIRIENNEFDTFDAPLLYAKSVDGLIYKKNVVRTNTEYPAFHWNKDRVKLENVSHAEIEK